jgi:hypothetical protein
MRSFVLAAAALGLLSAPALADEPPPTPPPPADETHGRPPPNPIFVHDSFGFNLVTYTAAKGSTPAATATPAKKIIIFQQVGFGYWPHPNVRLQLTSIFGETLTGLKPNTSSVTLEGIIPCAFYTNGGGFIGGGPLIAPRAFGTNGFNIGLFTLGGYAFKLGGPFTLALAVQVPVMFAHLLSVAVTPAVVLGQRF